ncbi:MAG: septum site-determining protein MinD [Ruminococcaceae bacterium]|nr:septum site-determining protein MinD [Oscillospiraceae bacterium]
MPTYNRLLIASSKGGVGKSTTALGLSVAFAKLGKRVLLVDLDVTSRSLDMLLGAEGDTISDFGDVIDGGNISSAAITPIDSLPLLKLISACNMDRLVSLADEQKQSHEELIRAGVERIVADGDYDILVCDTGGGLDFACAVADLFNMTVITSEQGKTSIRGAEYAASRLMAKGAKVMRLVICAFDLGAVKKENRAGIIEMIDSSSLVCVGVVPFDEKLQGLQDRGKLPAEKSTTAIAYKNIATRISGYDVKLFEGMGKLSKRRELAL